MSPGEFAFHCGKNPKRTPPTRHVNALMITELTRLRCAVALALLGCAPSSGTGRPDHAPASTADGEDASAAGGRGSAQATGGAAGSGGGGGTGVTPATGGAAGAPDAGTDARGGAVDAAPVAAGRLLVYAQDGP